MTETNPLAALLAAKKKEKAALKVSAQRDEPPPQQKSNKQDEIVETVETREWERHFQNEERQLQKLGLTIRKCKADGACLFRAFSSQIYDGDESQHQEIRDACVDFMERQKSEFETFAMASSDANSFADYCSHMRLPAVWGGDVEIGALARLYKRRIVVFVPSDEVRKVEAEARRQERERAALSGRVMMGGGRKKKNFLDELDDEHNDNQQPSDEATTEFPAHSNTRPPVSMSLREACAGISQVLEFVESDDCCDSRSLVLLSYHPEYHEGRHYNAVETNLKLATNDLSGLLTHLAEEVRKNVSKDQREIKCKKQTLCG